ncbi:FAD-dependent oxidoreductase [uncultured Desulfobacter sp.]|uniref:FAD-dependent oxidoreductase n=1 Tax=uncultured Desulfobacter sp. TaxID=240139 RepID=UPI002AA73344|nr:FAD-dependent oxidoreductase [uncultured Desulfobacter sp.]
MKKEQVMTFLVIGGDAAGMSAASKLKRMNKNATVTVLEMTEDVSYSACGMPYNIADPDRDMDLLVVRTADVFRQKNQINLLTGHRAEKVSPKEKKVFGTTLSGQSFEFAYDKLLIATGARPVMPNIPGIDLDCVLPLKNLSQGRLIKSFISEKKVKKAVIIGMGYIALEMCEAFGKRGVAVSMVKPGETFLPWMQADLSQMIQDELVQNKVALYAGKTVECIESSQIGARVVLDDLTLDADIVLVAAGVVPCSELAEDAGLELGAGGAIAVDRMLKTSDPDIYAAGDCADAYHVVSGEKCWIPLALRANRAGWAVADNICGVKTELKGVAGTSVFKVFDLQVARTGLTVQEANTAGFSPVENMITARSRAHGHPGSTPILVNMVGDKASGRLLGVQMTGTEGVAHRINAAAVALQTSMTVSEFFQSDLAYAPPFGPVWDPLLTAAGQLLKKM